MFDVQFHHDVYPSITSQTLFIVLQLGMNFLLSKYSHHYPCKHLLHHLSRQCYPEMDWQQKMHAIVIEMEDPIYVTNNMSNNIPMPMGDLPPIIQSEITIFILPQINPPVLHSCTCNILREVVGEESLPTKLLIKLHKFWKTFSVIPKYLRNWWLIIIAFKAHHFLCWWNLLLHANRLVFCPLLTEGSTMSAIAYSSRGSCIICQKRRMDEATL